jgi:glycosyltransferase involved in cell wall biosynthesis
MAESPRWIASRSFVPRKLPGLIWKGLDVVAPAAGDRYLDRLVRTQVLRWRNGSVQGGVPITVVGSFSHNFGVAKAAQIISVALTEAGFDPHRMDCSAVLRTMPGPPVPRPAAPMDGTMIFCINPPEMRNVLRHFGPRICSGKRLIGYWWWELDKLPGEWLPWIGLMDEIWVSSRFIHDAFSSCLPKKSVRYVPLPVPEPVVSKMTRRAFGLDADRFTVLVGFDLSSRWARKNPSGAIDAFRRAFPDSGEAQLVLKASGTDRHPAHLARLRALTADMPNARIIDRDLPAGDLAALVRSADVFLSLHRSEGLGLFIAEAMWLGTPVVATGWSGVMDMLDDQNSMLVRFKKVPVRRSDYPSVPRGAEWAEPDIDHAAECLRCLADDPDLRAGLRAKARARAERQFSLDRFRELAPLLLQPFVGKD